MLTREVSAELRCAYVEAGLWPGRPLFHFVDAALTRDPEKIAVADPHHKLSYLRFVELTKKVARVLLDLGVRPGEAVAIQAPNSVHLPIVHVAVNRVQGIYLPIHEQWRENEVRHLLKRSRARVLFIVGECKGFDHLAMLGGLRRELRDLEHVVPLTIGSSGVDDLPGAGDVLDEAVEARLGQVLVDADAPRHAMLSSGTTSMPKISEWSDNGLYAAFGRNYVDTARLTPDDIMLGVAPASTGATGYVYAVLAPLLLGATSVLQDPWDPQQAIELLDAERVTCLVAVPAQIVKMLGSPNVAAGSFSTLRCLSNGGAPLSEAHARQAEAVFGCRVHTMYGATDAGVPTSMDIDDPEDRRVTTVGRVVEGVELRTVDEANEPTAPGVPGEVVWRGAHKVLGYMNDEEATRAVFDSDGWYRSGDIGVLDDQGYLRIVGRKKDMILRGGQNIFPGEIEEILAAHPKVESVAVAAIPDPVLGDRACAFVIPTDPADPLSFDEMIGCLRSAKLVKYKWPERLEIVGEFPMSGGGKVQKAALTALVSPRSEDSQPEQVSPCGAPTEASRGPLDGIIVIEAAAFMSGPLAGVQLADLGATVLKVEPPSGDPFRRFGRPSTYVAPHFASINRGKQSVVLDLKQDPDRERLLELVRTADVFLANWRPGVDESLGLTDDVLARANPRLIRVAITGFGPDGPSADEPAFDTAVQARGAMMDAFAPTPVPVVLAGYPVDKMTALLATQSILAALFARERTGSGERIDLAMLDVSASVNFPDLFPARVFLEHQPDDPHNRHTLSIRPLQASDGYLTIAPGTGKQIAATFAAVDRPEWADGVLAIRDQVELVTALYAQLNSISTRWTVDELIARFRSKGVPCSPCVRMDDHFVDEQVLHNELYQIVDWPDIGPARVVRYPAVFGRWPRLVASSAPPKLGEHDALRHASTDTMSNDYSPPEVF